MSLFPAISALGATFGHATPYATAKRTPLQARTDLYPSWNVTEDAKQKTQQLSQAAKNELSKATAAIAPQKGALQLYSKEYYAACTFGGLMACGLTHWAVTPLDLVKCRRQVDAKLYKGNVDGWRKIIAADGVSGIYTGGGPTLLGYSVQGALKYGFYEFFKKYYSDLAGEENAIRYKTFIYLAGSASAEFIADIGLCPFEAVKVRSQTTLPPFAKGTYDGISKIVAAEGFSGLYKGIYPLWGRQIPYTMMKFASFESIVEQIYHTLPGQKSDYSKTAQTGIAFVGGYMAGILCAIVSHPADVMVSKLNANRQAGEGFGAAVGRIYKDIGFGGLWNGLPVRIVMVGTLTGLQWMIYDSFKIYMGFPTTGGVDKKAEQK
ncbi:hypothetical protein AMS68_001921 [Peltaster fructicola]|uniref:Mitochondrial phosphate carrier protein n=1 Tax=Peltaster fructicola TaxID=286661 RepID=A0A6H0XNV3_9PEZI|nr:hypothetical protein AMS68_001921 [Peltaster fructicola]